MAKKRAYKGDKDLVVDFGEVSDKQKKFLEAESFFVCYGGAKGGGKSHIARLKAVGMCLKEEYAGIRILMIRCHYPELTENLIRPIQAWLPPEIYSYNGTEHLMTFENGSVIKFGHYDGAAAEKEYQGVQYDVIFIDEATQLSERSFQYLQGCIRGVNSFPKRMYITCNPGGVGHRWVKRLFIDRDYKRSDDPELDENPEDYTFIPATVEDNPWMLKSTPRYLKNLSSMPPDQMRAFRYGDWDALGGAYFKNFGRHIHVVKPFRIPSNWMLYRSFDYGLDKLAVCWWAIDEDGRSWCYRYFEASDRNIQEAIQDIIDNTPPDENIMTTYAPWDMWSRQKESGKTIAEMFMLAGLDIVKSDSNRVHGHMLMRNLMQPIPLKDHYVKSAIEDDEATTLPALMIFGDCGKLISDINDIQADDKNPNDCAKIPHDVTHSVDAARYFCISRVMAAESANRLAEEDEEEEDAEQPYEYYMCGGQIGERYMEY